MDLLVDDGPGSLKDAARRIRFGLFLMFQAPFISHLTQTSPLIRP